MAVKTFNANSGPLLWVRAKENFFEAGEHVLIGDYVEVKEGVANWLQSLDRAVIVEEEDVQAAQAARTKKAEKPEPAK
jgi:S-adenosylhomocysteine hydrolase